MSHLKKCQESYWEFFKQPIIEKFNCKLVNTRIQSPWLNGVIAGELSENVIKEVVSYFDEQKLPFSWWVEAENEPPHFAQAMKDHGMEYAGDFDEMVLDLTDQEFLNCSSLAIELVTKATIPLFVDLLIQAYEDDRKEAEKIESLFSKGQSHFLGKKQGLPVVAGSLFIKEGIAAIHHIGTVPQARRKGYATSLMHALLKMAKEKGCHTSHLTSTPMGNALYNNLGYETIAVHRLYMRALGNRQS